MESENIFIVGDLHGCLNMLVRLIEKIPWRPDKDRLIFIGDYIDRGENPKGVVDYILSLQKGSQNVECLLGNHEAMFLDFLDGKNRDLFIMNGGWTTLESYGARNWVEEDPSVPSDHLAFYGSLKHYIELHDYYVVHAGFRPEVSVEDQQLKDMLWIRYKFIYSDYDFGKKVIFGHTEFDKPLILVNKIGIDTGAVRENTLTCLQLPEMKFHSVAHS
jgi:serine/threonine protein phosphatase 1